jgi:hypothetical protein
VASVKTELNDSTPDQLVYDLAYGYSQNVYVNVEPEEFPVTIYCTAQVSGKAISAVVSSVYDE